MTSFPRRCGDARPLSTPADMTPDGCVGGCAPRSRALSPLAAVLPAAFPSDALRRADAPTQTGPTGIATYTPGMRRWVCILTLLAGFSADGYAYSARPRITVPIERPLDEPRRAGAGSRGTT